MKTIGRDNVLSDRVGLSEVGVHDRVCHCLAKALIAPTTVDHVPYAFVSTRLPLSHINSAFAASASPPQDLKSLPRRTTYAPAMHNSVSCKLTTVAWAF